MVSKELEENTKDFALIVKKQYTRRLLSAGIVILLMPESCRDAIYNHGANKTLNDIIKNFPFCKNISNE